MKKHPLLNHIALKCTTPSIEDFDTNIIEADDVYMHIKKHIAEINKIINNENL